MEYYSFSSFPTIFFLLDLFIYLKVRVTQREERQREREREREVFHLLVHSPIGRNDRSCTDPKPEAELPLDLL